MTETAKVFKYRGGQAIRLPKDIRSDCDEVCIEQVGSCVMIFEKGKAWNLTKEALGQVTEDFMADREQPPAAEEREPF